MQASHIQRACLALTATALLVSPLLAAKTERESASVKNVSMEQTVKASRRIDKLVRIEQASRDHALKGPSIRAEQFAGDRSQPTAPTAVAPHGTVQHGSQRSY